MLDLNEMRKQFATHMAAASGRFSMDKALAAVLGQAYRLGAAESGNPRVHWKPLLSGLPDEEVTVLLYSPGTDGEVWVGFLESGRWHDLGGMPVENHGITHWADFPEPPPPF